MSDFEVRLLWLEAELARAAARIASAEAREAALEQAGWQVAGQIQSVTFSAGSLPVSVQTTVGAPIAGAAVVVRDTGGLSIASGVTDASGNVTMNYLWRSTDFYAVYSLEVSAAGFNPPLVTEYFPPPSILPSTTIFLL